MHVFWGQSYLTQEVIFQFHQFACKTHDVLILNNWRVFHSGNELHVLYPFFLWGTFELFPASSYQRERDAMDIMEHVSLWYCGAFWGYMSKSGKAGCSYRSISIYLRNLQIDFQSDCMSLQSYQQCKSILVSPHPHQHVLSPEFLILAILIAMRRNLRVSLICIFLTL